MVRAILIALTIILPLMLVGCVSQVLPLVPDRMTGEPATPPVLGEGDARIETVAQWEAGRAALQQHFMAEIYGGMPAANPAIVVQHDVIDEMAFGGLGRIEQYRLDLSGFEAQLVTVLPNHAQGPVPTVIVQLFCGIRASLDGREDIAPSPTPNAVDCPPGMMTNVQKMIWGEYSVGPPMEMLLERGYAVALTYPGDFVPDSPSRSTARMNALVPDGDTSAVAIWAWGYSRIIDVLDADPRFDNSATAVWGHSRNGKSALLAAVTDERVDLVIAHQAGTGGTTLSRSYVGESVAEITQSYGFWFAPRYAEYADNEAAIPVDQHQLIALMAPRPLLIGASWRDQWSDPQGSFRAAEGANPVYRLYGSDGLSQPTMDAFDPAADIAMFMRPGLHGVHEADWDYFVQFMDAHFSE
jgi:hypothetical protein